MGAAGSQKPQAETWKHVLNFSPSSPLCPDEMAGRRAAKPFRVGGNGEDSTSIPGRDLPLL